MSSALPADPLPGPAPPLLAPPVRPLPDPGGGFPLPLTSLLGRELEVAALAALLSATDVRIVTVTGPGGVGKTRLALAAAAEVAVAATAGERFVDGVAWVDLVPIASPALLPTAIATALGLLGEGGRSPFERVVDHIQERRLLLVLDNFEHLLGAAPVLVELLRASPGSTVLATSRERLGLSPEHDFPLAPLPLADPADAAPATSPAVRLFAERAEAAVPGSAPLDRPEVAAAVAAICARLDGLPLAIDLAAARASVLSPQALLRRLDRRLPLLTGGPRDAPDRQRTLRGAIAWSHDLLSEIERAGFRRLAVFAGGFGLEAADGVAGGGWRVAGSSSAVTDDPPPAALDLIASLVDKSLLRRVDDGLGPPRFGMLETIREFALERLVESGDAPSVGAAHARWCLALAEAAEPELCGPDQGGWMDRLEAEHPNLRAALAWLLANGEAGAGARLAAALWQFWENRGHLIEGRGWLERVVAVEGDPTSARAKALNYLGNVDLDLGAYPRARQRYEEALAIRRRLGDREGVARTLNNLGLLEGFEGDWARARACHEEGLALWRALGDRRLIAISLANLGEVVAALGEHAAAETMLRDAVAVQREVANPRGLAYALAALGEVAFARGDLGSARAVLEESLALFREIGGERGAGFALHTLGRVALAAGDLAAAAAHLGESLALRRRLADRRGLVDAFDAVAMVAWRGGRAAAAARSLGAADRRWRELGAVRVPAEQALLERLRGALRRHLGREFDAAWAEGRSAGEADVEIAAALLEEVAAAATAVESRTPPAEAGASGLTPREAEVLRLIVEGRTNRQIGDALFISHRTVASHVAAILAKLGVETRAATAHAVQAGLI